MGDDYQTKYYKENRERILAKKRADYATRGAEKNKRLREKTRRARIGRKCALCGMSIEHLTAKSVYCGRHCKDRAAANRHGIIPRSRASCRIQGCSRDVASAGLCGRHNHRRKRYGLTDEEMADLDAGVGCAICGDAATHVDHSHALGWGQKRGFLCRSCNLALGGFRDRIDLLEQAIDYLKASQ